MMRRILEFSLTHRPNNNEENYRFFSKKPNRK
jgi:hypothetical protein